MKNFGEERTQTIENQILPLAGILDKLWKIIQHSDPSASQKKRVFYEKYNEKLIKIAKDLKLTFQWDDIQHALNNATADSISVSPDHLDLIRKKLTKDLSDAILQKHELPSFEKPDPSVRKPREKMTVKRQRMFKKQDLEQEPYTRETLMDMVQQTKSAVKAKKELEQVIQKIRQIGPEIIEAKIKKLIKE